MARDTEKNKIGRGLIAGLLTLIIVLAAVLVFLYRDELFQPSIEREENSVKVDDFSDEDEAYTYENGARQQFDMVGNELAISSSTGLQVLDKNGASVYRQVFSMKNPALSTGKNHGAFYDIGGSSLRIYSDGETTNLDIEEKIISLSMNASGFFALSAEESGYKGSVTVFNNLGDPIYKWYSGTGYVLDATVSPDSKTLAVLTAVTEGSMLHLFRLSDEAELASILIPNELAFKLYFTDNSRLCALSETALHFFDDEGKSLSVMDFEGSYLIDYNISDDFCSVALSKYISGSSATITSLSANGDLLGTAEIEYNPLCLSEYGGKLLVLGLDTATLLSRDMRHLSETPVPAGYGNAILLSSGEALLLSSYHGEKIKL